MAGGVRKSRFSGWGNNPIPADTTFDFVYQGTNYKITYQDLINNLGVSGTIEQTGDPSGLPVLDVQGVVNAIRNIIAGNGINGEVDPQNGITLEHGFIQASGGQQVLRDPNVDSPQIRSIVAGTGIAATLNGSADGIIISATGGDVPISNNTVIVNTLDDLPPDSGGERVLAAGFEYFFNNDLEIDVPLRLQNLTVVAGTDNFITNLTYNGTGSMFVADDAIIKIKDLGITCPNAEIIRHTCSIPETWSVELKTLFVFAAASGGTFTNSFFALSDQSIYLLMSNGFTFQGSFSTVNMERIQANVSNGALFDLGTSVINFFYLSNAFVDLDVSGYLIDGATNSDNIEAGGIGQVLGVRTTGSSAPLNGVSVEDRRWEFSGCNQILDTRPDALLNLSAPYNAVFASPNVPIPIQGVWTLQRTSQFDALTTGVVEYNRLKPFITPFTASVTILNNSGNNQEFSVYWAKNGAVYTESGLTVEADNGEPETFTVIWQDQVNDGDFLQLYVENNTSSSALSVEKAIMRVN